MIAYFDCIGGASGDMILGAMLDAGLPEGALRNGLAQLNLPRLDLHCERVLKGGISAVKVDVLVPEDVPERRLPEMVEIVERSSLSDPIRQQAITILRRLGEVEARIHAEPLDQVHLHELGGLDTIADVVGALVGVHDLGIEHIFCSALPLGSGFTSSSHGKLPLPAPATLALLEGAPVVGRDIEVELVTPSGAALLTSLAEGYGAIPPMTLRATGYGAGSRDLPFPNLLRLLLGEPPSSTGLLTETLVQLETNIDDMNPQFYDHLMQRLFEAGALDVYLSQVQMKKNRPGTVVHVLGHPPDADDLAAILFAETSTLGIRRQVITRQALPRAVQTVDTPYGKVRVKVAEWSSGKYRAAPEYDDCHRLAVEHGVPLMEVHRAAQIAAEAFMVKP